MARRKRRQVSSRRRHSLAAKKSWRKSSRRRRKNPGYGYNPRRRYRHNPGKFGELMKAPFRAFDGPTIKEASLISAGSLATGFASGLVSQHIVSRIAPNYAGNQVVQGVVGLAAASMVGALASMIPQTRSYAKALTIGGVVRVVSEASSQLGYSVFSGLGLFGNYATEGDAARAQRMLGDYATEGGAAQAQRMLGDMGEVF